MIDPHARARKLLDRCFSSEQMEKLNSHPEFVAAMNRMETIQDALDTIDIGQQLIREDAATFRRTFLGWGSRETSSPPQSQR